MDVFKISESNKTECFQKHKVCVFFLGLLMMFVTNPHYDAHASSKQAELKSHNSPRAIPVVLDTDIGNDIDDTWALALLLNSPEFDIKLITTSTSDTLTKAKIVAKLLEKANRTDIPIGVGEPIGDTKTYQSGWVKDYWLSSYPGKVDYDGVGCLIDVIMNSPEPITLIAIGPLPNISEALRREPRIAGKADFVGMHGSIYKGYGNSDKIAPEHNVKTFPKASQKVFEASWKSMMITPLDTCGIVRLEGDKYQKILQSKNPVAQAVIDSYRVWSKRPGFPANNSDKPEIRSTILYDTVAVYLAMSTELVKMEKLPIRITDDGYTVIDKEGGSIVNCAIEWNDLEAFEDFLVERLVNKKAVK